ncbi:class I SAM-dependent methyltransferase [Sulfurimonas sp. HSL3-2]|uniref:class I SAM-dependent methyltransferase n=1 Tax=Hydrocurvibacter mobilis TaxID=3131936 RepID=UPI0031F7A6F7
MKENDIRPSDLFQKYIDLGVEDIKQFFLNALLKPINCPACNKKGVFAFNKLGFYYEECSECKTLYVSPRPEKKAFELYYSDSKSSQFWANEFYKETEKERREQVWKPKAKLVLDVIKSLNDIQSVVDIGGGYGIFIEELKKLDNNLDLLVIEPSTQLANVCKAKELNVKCCFFEEVNTDELPYAKTLYTSFELFEHLYDPKVFLEKLFSSMKSNDVFLFTTLNGMGVDIQTLWEKSKSVSPPHHLNFFNPKSIEKLLVEVGFEVLEISTPGKLDIDIMNNNILDIKDRFWKNFLEQSSESEKANMQKFISEHLLSSHMMILCKKRG